MITLMCAFLAGASVSDMEKSPHDDSFKSFKVLDELRVIFPIRETKDKCSSTCWP